jgi:hypothetical protein
MAAIKLDKEIGRRIRRLKGVSPIFVKFCKRYGIIIRPWFMQQAALTNGVFEQLLSDRTLPPLTSGMTDLAAYLREMSEHAKMAADDIELRLIAGQFSPVREHKKSPLIENKIHYPATDLMDLAMFETHLNRNRFMCLELNDAEYNSYVNGLLMNRQHWYRGKVVNIVPSKRSDKLKYVPYSESKRKRMEQQEGISEREG